MKTIAFFGTVEARSVKTLVCGRLSRPYIFKGLDAKFPSGCENLVRLRFYISPDDSAPASGAPSGSSILEESGQVDYIVGDGDTKRLLHEVIVDFGGTFLKVYAENNDFWPHGIDVQMYLEELEAKG